MAKSSASAASKNASGDEIRTQRELAGLLSRDEGRVSRYLRDDRWPFSRKAPWPRNQLAEMHRWVAEELGRSIEQPDEEEEGDSGEGTKGLRDKKLKAEIRKHLAQAQLCELQLARESGSSLDASAVKTEWANLGQVVRNGFQNLASALVPVALRHGMPHTAAMTFQNEADQIVTQILEVLSANKNDSATED